MTTKTEPTGKALTDARLRAGLSLRTAAELLELTPRELGDRQPQPSAPTAESGKAWEPKPGNRCRARVAGRWYEATLREPSAGAPMWLVIIDERGDEIPFGAYWVPTVDLSEPATDASAPTAETDRCDRCAVKLFEMESDVRAARAVQGQEPMKDCYNESVRRSVENQATLAELVVISEAEAKALADVRTLDEWASAEPTRSVDVSVGWRTAFADMPHLQPSGEVRARLLVEGTPYRIEYGPTPDAARAAAAAWVREQGKGATKTGPEFNWGALCLRCNQPEDHSWHESGDLRSHEFEHPAAP